MILEKLLSYMPVDPPLTIEFCSKRIFFKQPAEVFANILDNRTPHLRYFLNPHCRDTIVYPEAIIQS